MPAPSPNEVVLALDIGGTKIAAGLVDANGRCLVEHKVATPASEGVDAIIAACVALTQRLERTLPQGRRPIALGVGSGGQFEWPTGRVLSATSLLPGWEGLSLAKRLEEATGLPTIVDNDVHAAALGEAWLGAGQGVLDFVCVFIGTGVGGAIVSNGHLLRGAVGAAGELGHLLLVPGGRRCSCGRQGCLEAYVSGPALLLQYNERVQAHTETETRSPTTVSELVALAKAGDAAAQQVLATAHQYLGSALASIANILNPSRILLGGGVIEAGAFRTKELATTIRREALGAARHVEVICAKLGTRAGLLGAARLAWDYVAQTRGNSEDDTV